LKISSGGGDGELNDDDDEAGEVGDDDEDSEGLVKLL
jgi:hypothetical protein